MSVIVSQIDMGQAVCAVAVVDKYGDVVAHCSFAKLTPPRKVKPERPGQERNEEENRRINKLEMQIAEEKKDHDKELENVKLLIRTYNVDLVVVGANKLEARLIKKTLTDLCASLKDEGKEADDKPSEYSKEVFVIWGSLEVPRLFSTSYNA